MNSKIEALVLDLGGIVYKLDWTATNRLLGLDLNVEWWAWPEYDAYERGQLTTADFQRAFEQRISIHSTADDFENALQRMIVAPLSGVEDLLRRVRVPLYALSNTNHAHQAHFQNDSVMKVFRKIFASFEMGLRKPEPAIYLNVIEAIQSQPKATLFVDDREDNLKGAASVGIQTALCLDDTKRLQQIFEKYDLI